MKPSSIPQFLLVKAGDYVKVNSELNLIHSRKSPNSWIGQVINCIGGARDPNSWTLFQVLNIDNGEILCINADAVEMILKTTNKNN